MLKKILPVAIIAILLLLGIAVLYSIRKNLPDNPLEGSSQVVLVIAEHERATDATLIAYDLDGDTWRSQFSGDAVLGVNGLAWGPGLQNQRSRVPEERAKVEGDGCAPMGAFLLLEAYGEVSPYAIQMAAFPYTQITGDMICVDAARSEYYNLIVRADTLGITPEELPSHEDMLRDDGLYRFLITVGYNYPDPVPGAGSCIFIHLWRGPGTITAGCTAVADETMFRLLGWLDASKRPVMVQLTRKAYERLSGEWELPDIGR